MCTLKQKQSPALLGPPEVCIAVSGSTETLTSACIFLFSYYFCCVRSVPDVSDAGERYLLHV